MGCYHAKKKIDFKDLPNENIFNKCDMTNGSLSFNLELKSISLFFPNLVNLLFIKA